MADDVSVSNPEDDDEITADDFFRDLGFDPEDEEELSSFLTWLYPLGPTSEHDMALILSGSEYSELDPGKVYFLWEYLRSASFLDTPDTGYLGPEFIDGAVYYGVDGNFYVIPNYSSSASILKYTAKINFETFVDQRIAAAGVLTQTDLSTIEDLLRDIRLKQSQTFMELFDIDYDWDYLVEENRLRVLAGNRKLGIGDLFDLRIKELDQLLLTNFQALNTLLSTNFGDFNSLLTLIKNATVSTNGLLIQYFPAFADAVYLNSGGNILSYVHEIRDVSMDYLPFLSTSRTFSYNQTSNTLTSVSGGNPIGITEMVDVNFKDLDSLLLKNFGSSFGFDYGSGDSYFYLSPGSSLMEVLSAIGSTFYLAFNGFIGPYLTSDGYVSYSPYLTFEALVSEGLVGFDKNMETSLVGGHGGSAQYSRLTFDENLYKSTEAVNYTDLLHAMVGIGSDIQNPLSQLQAVLAGDADLELHRNTQENIDSVTDNFTGSGDGSVSSGDISDASGLTSGIGNAFGGNPVSVGAFFSVSGDSGNWDFFSEASAQSLDTVTYPVAVALDADDDSWMDAFVADENGFYSVADLSGWSVLDYLGKEG